MLFSLLTAPFSFHLSLSSSCLTEIQDPRQLSNVARYGWETKEGVTVCVYRRWLDFIIKWQVMCENSSRSLFLNVAGRNYGTRLLNKLINKEHFFSCFKDNISEAIIQNKKKRLSLLSTSGDKYFKSENNEVKEGEVFWALVAKAEVLVGPGHELFSLLPVPLPKDG